MWEAIKNVTTYGAAILFVLVVLIVGFNLVCCGSMGTLGLIGAGVEGMSTEPNTPAPEPNTPASTPNP